MWEPVALWQFALEDTMGFEAQRGQVFIKIIQHRGA